MTLSPTQLSLRHLRAAGYTAEVVEHWNSHVQHREDLFGFVDVLGVRPGETIAVQTTTVGGVSARLKKIGDSPLIGAVREAGWTIHVHGWKKVGNRWHLARCVDVS